MEIREVREGDLASFNAALNEVCAERRYLASVEGFSLARHREFFNNMSLMGNPQVVALDGEVVVGWCDIVAETDVGFSHVGRLGMGVLRAYRGRGIGRRLVLECLQRARARGLERVELEVFSDNRAAIHLYEQVGFAQEGCRRRARKLDGRYQDVLLMGLLLDARPSGVV